MSLQNLSRFCARPLISIATTAFLLAACAQGTGLGVNIVPQAQVQAMGLQSWNAIRQQTKASQNARYQQAAREVSEKVLRAAGENPSAWEVVVFEGSDVNAFALPGNKIGVYEGMFGVATTSDQLAAVIGHEIAHVHAQHAEQRVNTEASAQMGTQLIAQALGAANVAPPDTVAKVVGTGIQYGVTLPYSRNQELQADEMGLTYMTRAGYNPRAAVELWRKMGSAGSRPMEFLSTHPDPTRRMQALEAKINAMQKN